MPDVLPPSNVSWPNSDDQARDIAIILQGDTWPSLWPSTIPQYATTAARDAALAGLTATDRQCALVHASESITYWNGTAWGDAKVSTDTGWLSATLNGSWTNASGITTQYRRFNGAVEVRGNVIRGASAPAAFFTLPAGYRPSTTVPLGGHVTSGGVVYELFAAPTGTVGFASSGYSTASTSIGDGHPVGGSFLL